MTLLVVVISGSRVLLMLVVVVMGGSSGCRAVGGGTEWQWCTSDAVDGCNEWKSKQETGKAKRDFKCGAGLELWVVLCRSSFSWEDFLSLPKLTLPVEILFRPEYIERLFRLLS